jgi:hypothetical protein
MVFGVMVAGHPQRALHSTELRIPAEAQALNVMKRCGSHESAPGQCLHDAGQRVTNPMTLRLKIDKLAS